MTTPEPVSPAPDTEALRQQVAEALMNSRDPSDNPAVDESHRHANHQYSWACHLCTNNVDALTDALLPLFAELAAENAMVRHWLGQAQQVRDEEVIGARTARSERDEARTEVAGLRADLDRARAEVERLEKQATVYRNAYGRTEKVLDKALGTEEHDGAGEGQAADVYLLMQQRDQARAELARVSGALPIPDDAAAVEKLARWLFRMTGRRQGEPLYGDGAASPERQEKRWNTWLEDEDRDRLREMACHVLADLGATPTTDPVQRLTLAELHAVLHANLLAECGCTGGPDCAARFHGHGCALDPCGEALATPTTGPAPAAADGGDR